MPDSLKHLFSGLAPSLERLAKAASEADRLAQRIRAALPPEVAGQVVAATRRGDELVVVVSSAAWSAQVRYAGRALREALAADGEPEVKRVRVRVGGGGTGQGTGDRGQ